MGSGSDFGLNVGEEFMGSGSKFVMHHGYARDGRA